MFDKSFYDRFGIRISNPKSSDVAKSGLRRVTGRNIAENNHLGYMDIVLDEKPTTVKTYNFKFYLKNERYCILSPINNGHFICNVEWYSQDKLILDNMSSFNCITNLSEILLQMVLLYQKYIDYDVVIMPYNFAICLNEAIRPNYVGSANLVITEDCIVNNRVEPTKIREAKNYCVNIFLDRFLGMNFGCVITQNPELEREIINLHKYCIKMGYRKIRTSDLSKFTEFVRPYKFKR